MWARYGNVSVRRHRTKSYVWVVTGNHGQRKSSSFRSLDIELRSPLIAVHLTLRDL